MASERLKFMYAQSLKDFTLLAKHIGERVKINYVKDGNILDAIAMLKDVVPFEYIVTALGKIDFVSARHLIRQITTTVGEKLYDRAFMIPKQAKAVGDILRYKLAILGGDRILETAKTIVNELSNDKPKSIAG